MAERSDEVQGTDPTGEESDGYDPHEVVSTESHGFPMAGGASPSTRNKDTPNSMLRKPSGTAQEGSRAQIRHASQNATQPCDRVR